MKRWPPSPSFKPSPPRAKDHVSRPFMDHRPFILPCFQVWCTPLSDLLVFVFVFVFIFGRARSMWKFLGWGVEPTPQQWHKPLQWWYQILTLQCHRGTPSLPDLKGYFWSSCCVTAVNKPNQYPWGSGVAMSCGVGRRCNSDPALL